MGIHIAPWPFEGTLTSMRGRPVCHAAILRLMRQLMNDQRFDAPYCVGRRPWKNNICSACRARNRHAGLEGALSLVPLEAPEGALTLAPAGRLSLSAGGEHG